MSAILLREVTEVDLPTFFEQQRDSQANRMAAFPARERAAFMAHWKTNILGDGAVIKKTILYGDQVAGNIVCYRQSGTWLVGYWLGRNFWGMGIATAALSEFIRQVELRPLVAFVAKHNAGSIRVLEKCGFALTGEGVAPALDGSDGVEEFTYTLAT